MGFHVLIVVGFLVVQLLTWSYGDIDIRHMTPTAT